MFRILLLLLAIYASSAAHALTPEQALAMAAGETDARIQAVQQAAGAADPQATQLLQALADDAVKVAGNRVFIVRGEQAVDAVSGQPADLPADAEDVISNNRMRGEIETALAGIRLFSTDARERAQAVRSLASEPDESRLPLIDKALQAETDASIRAQLELLRAAVMLASDDAAKRREAALALAESRSPATRTLLLERIAAERDPAARAAMQSALRSVESRLAWAERAGQVFSGISLGSILLLVALGLAITYGLMGVINMAHGELMMIGAYATYVVQGLFQRFAPGAFDFYLVAAVPVAFGASALMGAILERGVIRFLYGRPLETLLATWGISLMLMQGVRSVFGAQNVGVENPSWMSGGVVVLGSLQLPWNRIVIIGFALAVLAAVAWLIARTRLGLFVRGVTQNRPIAACMGVNTARTDTLAFALGSGIAGLAGCALSQVGNVGPDLGQSYIVDAFMVVVLGGVGQLAGTVYAALGLGVINKFLEGWAGAVLAKIAVLVMIVLVIQKRPQGLFALKGREA
ncbi:urea ABC transporter permease subunit UrtB [Ramlibacter sp. AW1]|uniref:Urea ABC transporter permease subunit UrtB n=1 Tax=Ramlibacter aurantiacus TaxID=2801330 RepID=A0A936ZNX8_9BURK|nr:urea ABC transporter permease subunit UrtB [Ramlibacter aurantiacus]MBL0420820.1 urea ABC transporter permease subunit UrtB [Ramlibacter aurantiacus]